MTRTINIQEKNRVNLTRVRNSVTMIGKMFESFSNSNYKLLLDHKEINGILVNFEFTRKNGIPFVKYIIDGKHNDDNVFELNKENSTIIMDILSSVGLTI